MKKECLIFGISLVIITTFLIPKVASPLYLQKDKQKQTQPEFAPNRLILKLKPEIDKKISLGKASGKITTGVAKLDSLNFKFDVTEQEKLFKEFKETALKSGRLQSVYILEVPAGTDLKNMKAEYEKLPEVEYVELDYILELYAPPDDPLFEHQWYLNNLAQGYLGIDRIPGDYNDLQVVKYGTVDADIDALEVFERNIETTIPLVGIIDTGVDLKHEDLTDNLWTNPGEIENNGIDDDHNGFVDDFYGWDFSGDSTEAQEDNDPTDYYGHGTHLAGIVGAVKDNSLGISGINTPCRIVALKFFPNSFFSLAAKSIIYAADMGCEIINISWGSPFPSKLIQDALDYAIYRGVLPIAAAGNSGMEEYFYPGALPQVFTVGASNSKDEVTYFSTYGNHIEVVAPGEDILSLRAENTDMYAEGGASGIEPLVHIVDDRYYLADGTSMASPCVVGVAAYILAASPGISKPRVKEIIQESADDILYPYGGDSLYSPGKDIYSGYGRVNLNSALELLSGRLAKIDYPYENAIVSGNVPVLGTASGDSFQSYILEYGEGLSPLNWIEIANSNLKVVKDTLGIWNSTGLTGLYTLRLRVGDQNITTRHVIAQNEIYVKISSPAEDDTIRGYAQVYGFTIAPDFSHYLLEYGSGEFPAVWDTIMTSTKIVADQLLGSWLVSFLAESTYTLRLTAYTNTGNNYSDSVSVLVRNITSGGWVKDLINYGSLSPAVSDIDGDGYDEIVIGVGGPPGAGKSGGIEVFNHLGEREPGWPKDTSENMCSSPALGDLDGDGLNDIVICSEKGVFAYLSYLPNWFRSCNTGGNDFWSLATPLITDLDSNGYLEVMMINSSGTVYAWRNNGESFICGKNGVFAQATLSNIYEGFPSLAVADLDKDGKNEVMAGSAYIISGDFGHYTGAGGIYIWDIDGNLLLSPGDYPDKLNTVFGLAIANLDSIQDLEVIIFGQNETHPALYAFKKDGTQAVGFPIILDELISGYWYGNHPAIGDLEGDGSLEIVVSLWTLGEARIYAWHQDGTPLSFSGSLAVFKPPDGERKTDLLLNNRIGEIIAKIENIGKENFIISPSPFKNTVFASVAETFGSPILADVNQDGYLEIIARAGYLLSNGYERLFAWDYEGNLVSGWPLYVSSEIAFGNFRPYTPLFSDLDRDNKLNLILATDWPFNKLISLEFPVDYNPNTLHWPKYMHDNRNSGVFRKEEYVYVEDKEKIELPSSFSLYQNYPNPFNPTTTIPFRVYGSQFMVHSPIHTSLKIYNILGQLVRTLLDEEKLPGSYQVIWDGKDEKGKQVSSGIYFYRLEAGKFVQSKRMVLLK